MEGLNRATQCVGSNQVIRNPSGVLHVKKLIVELFQIMYFIDTCENFGTKFKVLRSGARFDDPRKLLAFPYPPDPGWGVRPYFLTPDPGGVSAWRCKKVGGVAHPPPPTKMPSGVPK